MRKRLTTVLAGVAALIATSFALAPGASADAFRCGNSGSDPRATGHVQSYVSKCL
ncbi:hypothetical protein [Streptomyces sp. PTY087I2]|uniref:hypothetical protein n=1 Tax=Streptomyces sp. PTY087I2 TaxID=1819298 RepID=UPI000827DA18|nr:hypothetical protein [Streptomyces sp. PTY087I2]OCC10054.1 hypothetical protein A3Q37_04196 [Streptomyces sp. PTY087I2]